MAAAVRHDENELYVFGMLSVVQSVLNLSPGAISEAIELRADLMDALSGTDNHFSKLLVCSQSLGSGDWARFSSMAASLGHPEDDICRNITLAQHWADTVLAAAA